MLSLYTWLSELTVVSNKYVTHQIRPVRMHGDFSQPGSHPCQAGWYLVVVFMSEVLTEFPAAVQMYGASPRP